jgi:methylase of polypeptide subunit release factors
VRGQISTPPDVADHVLELLLRSEDSTSDNRFLFPGVGTGPFVEAVQRYCRRENKELPEGLGVDSDPEQIDMVAEKFADSSSFDFVNEDFLQPSPEFGSFDYVIGNPPYVPIQKLEDEEKEDFQVRFDTAYNRFDLYFLFFERALELLKPGGRLAFVTPEKFEYVDSAEPLRQLLSNHQIEYIEHLGDGKFSGYTAYPTITVLTKERDNSSTKVVLDSGERHRVKLSSNGESWASRIRDSEQTLEGDGQTLEDITERISVGVATGADKIFVKDAEDVPPSILDNWTFPTVSGRELEVHDGIEGSESVFVCPYNERGELYDEDELGDLKEWLKTNPRQVDQLNNRSCVKKDDESWYGWHENPQMQDILQPKIVWRDITNEPKFWIDEEGEILPRHTVYYLIPEDSIDIHELNEYLNTQPVRKWLFANCQRAQNGYIRLQSRVLKDLPVPEKFH